MSSFTLYPPGYAPFQRQPVMNLAPDGTPIHGEGDREQTDFGGTLFEAALEARQGRPWARASHDAPERWWATQGRHLRLAARLVGVARDLSDQVRSSIAVVLSVDTLQLRDGSRAAGYRGIGGAICAVISGMKRGTRRAMWLLICGHLIGHRGEPLYWDAERQLLERSPFRPPRTDAVR